MAKSTKRIKIEYDEVNEDNVENSIVMLFMDYPDFKEERKMYLYELSEFDEVKDMLLERQAENYKYSFFNYDYLPHYLDVRPDTYKLIEHFLKSETDYEQGKWNDEVSLLNAILSVYRKDPKNWET